MKIKTSQKWPWWKDVSMYPLHSPYQTVCIKPKEKVIYNKHNNKLNIEKTTTKMETAWLSKELAFREEKLENVFVVYQENSV